MDIRKLNKISPFVRLVKITKSRSLAGEWQDYDHVFTYIEQGKAVFVLDGVTYEVSEGDAILMHPLMPHIIRSASARPLIQYIFHFDCYYDEERSHWTEVGIGMDKQRQVPPQEMLFQSINPVSHIRAIERMDVNRRFLMMHKEFMDRQYAHSIMLKSIAVELLAIFFRHQTGQPVREKKVTKGWTFIEKCIQFIQQNYDDPTLDNDQISRHVGISTSYMTYLFKEQLGTTVHKYLNHVRIEEAKRRILENKDSLTLIAEQTGFSGIHQFSRVFRNYVGMTASQYMAIHSNSQASRFKPKVRRSR